MGRCKGIFFNALADDTGIYGNSRESASSLVENAVKNFDLIGLEINYNKSVAIIIEDGNLSSEDLIVSKSIKIRAIKENDTIRYLGVTFGDEIKFDEAKIIQKLNDKLNKIVSTTMLRPDQKLQIINVYIFPTLIYPFQTAPLGKLKKSFLEDVDKIIRHSVKEILQIPDDIPTNMLYSSKSVKGLELIRASWEAYIQNINALHSLQRANNPIINKVRKIDIEIKECLKKLDMPENFLDESNKRHVKKKPSDLIRNELKSREYIKWCALRSKGKGVSLFEDCPKINKNAYSKVGLTTSEWISYFKMVGGVSSVRATPGRSTGTNRCRINICNEIETLPHVLGYCHHGKLLRLNRHNKCVKKMANALRQAKWSVHEEFSCLSTDGSTRRVDILAFDEKSRNGFILDPTIRFEFGDNQAMLVNEEKQDIYNPCIPDILKKCKLRKLEVIGLLIGARGTIPKFFKDICTKFKIPSNVIEDIAVEVIKDSCKILHNHLYDPGKI